MRVGGLNNFGLQVEKVDQDHQALQYEAGGICVP
jgi:hypothetical protein